MIDVAVSRLRQSLEPRPIEIALPDHLPLVSVDAVLLDVALANVLDNVARHTPPQSPLAIRTGRHEPGMVRLVIEDGGPGVPDSNLPRLFDKFYRVGGPGEGSRRGMGIGLSVVRGTLEAMGGGASANRSILGGLAVELNLPVAAEPPTEEG